MVTVNIPIDENLLERVRQLSEKAGRTVEQAARRSPRVTFR